MTLTERSPEWRRAMADEAMTRLSRLTRGIVRAVDRLTEDPDHDVDGLAFAALNDDRAADVATVAAILAVQRQRLADLENTLATALGKAAGKHIGELADGSRYEVTRSADRKAWDHDGWKRDTRRAVVEKVAGPVRGMTLTHTNLETGEVVETALGTLLQEAVTMAQEVHGSTSPRTKALADLGLYASDYAESSPGPWRLSFIKPDTTTPKD